MDMIIAGALFALGYMLASAAVAGLALWYFVRRTRREEAGRLDIVDTTALIKEMFNGRG